MALSSARKEALGLLVSCKGGIEILRDRHRALRRVSDIPPTIRFCLLNAMETSGRHAPFFYERERTITILFRPFAVGFARRETDQPPILVELVELTIDPAMTERAVDGFLA